MKFIIKRDEWARGANSVANMLFDPKRNTRCCLGFFGLACGFTDDELKSEGLPSEQATAEYGETKWPEWLTRQDDEQPTRYIGTYAESRLCHLNDTPATFEYPEVYRERDIAKEFARYGVEVEFT